MYKRSLCVVLLIAWCSAQNPEWLYLSGKTFVYTVKNQGDFLWIGTSGGLVQFHKQNGRMVHYNTANSGLKNNKIRGIDCNAQNTLWVGTDWGLAHFDGKQWYSYSPTNIPQMSLPRYSAIALDTRNRVWAGTTGCSKLTIFDNVNWIFYNAVNPALPENSVTCIKHGWKGKTIVGISFTSQQSGLCYADESTCIFDTNVQQPVQCITMDADSNLWIGTMNSNGVGNGLYRYNGSEVTLFDTANSAIPSNTIYCCAYRKDGAIIVGSPHGLESLSVTNTFFAYLFRNS
jgi:ligand-binding sensor domain-containing protein